MKDESDNKLVKVGIIGTITAVAACCAIPVLLILLGAVGLGTLTGYLEYILPSTVVIFILITAYGFWKKQKRDHEVPHDPHK